MNNAIKIIGIVALVVVSVLVVHSLISNQTNIDSSNTAGGEVISDNTAEPELDENQTTTIQIPLTSYEEEGEFGPFGCQQYLNFHDIEVPETEAVLTSVYQQLFTLPYDVSGTDDKNIIASQINLNFDSVSIQNGVASVYLSGSVMGNHCADEVFRHQIQQAAFQFDTVNSIQVYLNNQIFDWCILSDADPSESGCDINPKPWIANKN
jgi:hypothetical protein